MNERPVTVVKLATVVKPLIEVLIGRDRAPAWRSAAARRLARAGAWGGFALLAVGVAMAAVLPTEGRPPAAGAAALGWMAVGLAVSSGVALTQRFALLAWRIGFAGVLLTPLIPGQTRADAGYYAVLAVTLAVAGTRYGPWHTWWMWGLSLIPVWLWTGPDWVYPTANTGWLALLAVATHAEWYWRRDRRALTELARRQAARADQQRERNAVLEERARIAREMHDVVAHHMSMIAVQAETAPYRVPDLPGPAREEFAALSAAAREALTEMRLLLGVLRSEGSGDSEITDDNSNKPRAGLALRAELTPQPRLDDVPELVETARRAGALVTLDMPSPARPVPPGVGLAAYRIVQESLSNAARHAPGAGIAVVIEQDRSCLWVSVTNSSPAASPAVSSPAASPAADHAPAPGTPAPGTNGSGHGLAGMRERAALLGGELSAGPESGGGFAVRALLPVGDAL